MTTNSTSLRSSADRWPLRLGATDVHALWTRRRDGDLRDLGEDAGPPEPVPPTLAVRRVRQVHGARVFAVGSRALPGTCDPWRRTAAAPLPEGDALVSDRPGFCLAVLTADCAPVALASSEGVHGAIHVGWRGLVEGVVERSVRAMRALGATRVWAGLGPCIHPCCYAFEADWLDILAGRYGANVRSKTTDGRRALDLPHAVREALETAGAHVALDVDECTACAEGPAYFSYRARGEEQRQGLLVWSRQAVP